MQGRAVDAGLEAVRARWASGRVTVVRLAGPGARAEASRWLATATVPVHTSWRTGTRPEGAGAIWLGRGPGARLAADLLVGAVLLLDLPWLVVLTDDALDAGPDRGAPVEVPGTGDAEGEEARVEGPLCPAPTGPEALEAGLRAAVEQGRIVEAAAWALPLRAAAPDRALAWRWVEAARAHHLLRRDGLALARELRARGGPDGLAALLAHSAFLVPRAQREPMLHAAADRAPSPRERADARFLLDRSRMSHGAVHARDLRWPASTWLMARMLYFRVEKLEKGSGEREALVREVRALDCALGDALLHTAELDVEGTTLEGWVDDAARYLALGQVHQAAFDLSGKTMAPGDDALRRRIERGLARLAPETSALPRLDRAVHEGDWATARAVARDQLERERYGGFLHTVMDVVVRVAGAVLDGDGAPLVAVESEPLQEYLQPAFPELIEAAVPYAPEAVRPRLLAQAARWWRRLGHDAEAPCLEALASAAPVRRVPLGDYDMIEAVGAGGMGEVWRGVHVGLGEPVAIKLLRASAADKAALFLEEVELTARLDHEAIVHVHDAGIVGAETAAASGGRFTEGTPYLVMEYVPDGTLRSVRERLDGREVQAILLAVLDALAHAHARGVVHRDLKPDNLLVVRRADGLRIRLSDFGLAGVRQRGLMSGTPHYMAPEQFEGREVGPAADLYAVGCLATWLVTGRSPFRGSVRDLAIAHRFEAPPPLAAGQGSGAFDAWRLRLLAKAPLDRFPSAWAAREALRALEDPATAAATEAALEANDTFVFATLAGMTATPEPAPLPTAGAWGEDTPIPLPETGFRVRRARPRMPTTRLFARRDPPRVGHHRARQQLWRSARRAVEQERVVSLPVWVHPAVELDPLVQDLVLRLRELGVPAGDGPGAGMEVAVGRAPSSSTALRLDRVPAPEAARLRVGLLDHEAMVAWLQAQVRLAPDLAWELARRTLGSPRLGQRLLDEVLRLPMVPGPEGLALGGALPASLRSEDAWWTERLARLGRAERDALAWASVWVPGFRSEVHEAVAGPGAAAALAPHARCVRGRWTLTEGLRELLREGLRERGELAARHAEAARRTEGARRALHLLHAGDDEALERLLVTVRGRLDPGTRPPDGDLLRGLALALDLDLAPPDGEGRAWLALARARRWQALGRPDAARRAVEPLCAAVGPLGDRAWERWLDLADAEALEAAGSALAARRRDAEGAMGPRLALAEGLAWARHGRIARAEACLASATGAAPWALGRAWARWRSAQGDLAGAAARLDGCAPTEGTSGWAPWALDRADVARRLGDPTAGSQAEAVAARTQGPLEVAALTLAARVALAEGRTQDALLRAQQGLDYLVGTAWPGPRARLEALGLAAIADRPGDDWELRWLARSEASDPVVAEALARGAERAAAAGLAERARRLRAAADQPRKG